MGDLPDAASLLDTATSAGSFLQHAESTPMTKSYKMLVLLGMLQEGCFPGEIAIEELTQAVERLARRSPALVADIGTAIESPEALQLHLETNPINAWTGGRGTRSRAYFAYQNEIFRTTFQVPPDKTELFCELTREIAEYRLAEYLLRPTAPSGDDARFHCRVSHADGRPILFLPDRGRVPGIPEGWVSLVADGEPYEANFVKVAVNVIRRPSSEENELPALLRRWFGEQAGTPGTRAEVEFCNQDGQWVLHPVRLRESTFELWRSYARSEVAEQFGEKYSRYWEQGFVRRGQNTFLFVTLDKSDLPEAHRYGDRFVTRDVFEWQSQNRTRRETHTGEDLRSHAEKGITVHLFVRKQAKLEGRGARFVYCGPLQFVDWEGDQPITIRWRLGQPVPDTLWTAFATSARADS
jgi:hypothetical protein